MAMTQLSSKNKNKTKMMTYGKVVNAFRNGLSAELDAKCVLARVLDSVINAESAISIVLDINVHVTK